MINNIHTLTPAPAPPPEEACLRLWGTFWILSSLGSDLEELQHCLNMILSYPGQRLPSNQFLRTRATSVCKNMSYSWWSLSKVLFCHCLCLFQSFLDSIAAATKYSWLLQLWILYQFLLDQSNIEDQIIDQSETTSVNISTQQNSRIIWTSNFLNIQARRGNEDKNPFFI